VLFGLRRGDGGGDLIIRGAVGRFTGGLKPRVFEDLFEIGSVLSAELQEPLDE
jgi:hypothetical protein